eukprot:TRINITY_DN4094_c0_g1_i1.p2 TRINITY_DN4094_c0_g1~~TRINITY_DN4094_c0_g1_i1.p2  ORF type:complete len:155 (-),score=61.15 TRINITY_DN4094_c0_g1_i1:294-758(-)
MASCSSDSSNSSSLASSSASSSSDTSSSSSSSTSSFTSSFASSASSSSSSSASSSVSIRTKSRIRKVVATPSVDPKQREKEATIHAYIDRNMRVTTTDGRCFVGRFNCFDNNCNVILAGVTQFPSVEESEKKTNPKTLGNVLVGGKHIIKCELI